MTLSSKAIAGGAAILLTGAAAAGTDVLDLSKRWLAKEDLRNGWEQSGLEQYTDQDKSLYGAAYFNGNGDWIRSPAYSQPVKSIRIESATRSPANFQRTLSLSFTCGDSSVKTIPLEPPTNELASVVQTVDVADCGTSQFTLTAGEGSGNWAVWKITVVWGDGPDEEQPGVWQCSDFLPAPGSRSLNVLYLGRNKKEAPWVNGEDGDGMLAFANSAPASSVRPATASSIYGGLYFFKADDTPTVGLAMLGSGSTDVQLILPVKLNAGRGLGDLSVSYEAWTVKMEEAATALSLSWTACDDLDALTNVAEIVWSELPKGRYEASSASESRTVSLSAWRLRRARYALVRWSVPKQANSSLLGIANVRVSGRLGNDGGLIVLR